MWATVHSCNLILECSFQWGTGLLSQNPYTHLQLVSLDTFSACDRKYQQMSKRVRDFLNWTSISSERLHFQSSYSGPCPIICTPGLPMWSLKHLSNLSTALHKHFHHLAFFLCPVCSNSISVPFPDVLPHSERPMLTLNHNLNHTDGLLSFPCS